MQFPETGWDPARDPWPHCLRGAISEGFSLVVYEGGSVAELVGCAESRGIVALYALHEGVYVSHILGAPDFVNAGFLELFPDGLPPITPLVAASNGPPSADPFGDLDDGGGSRGRSACAATSPRASASSSTRGAASMSWRPARRAGMSPPSMP